MALNITAIKKIVNRTNQSVEVRKRDNLNDIVILKPFWEVCQEIWIPGIVNQQEFDDKVIEISYLRDNKRMFMWQLGNKVRFSKFGFDISGKPVDGICATDGDRMLIIDENSISLELIR
ncbi:hypothetical protein FLAVO9AF_640009 [Flavobacterium sp. 9AF]|uniref:hypothetical protein n=1 Tax=Flavobacterium sp. 9AF TaxID=2653142 RepID=UPI0012F0DF57|nr:hypothetical protein [Flavobacterium sp. 9AF]VXC16865.1 hypothetical protein FLAVO9AF_640009 [Flavobacterium sp. 9AF]